MIADIGLGSNVGDRLGFLQSAVDGFRDDPKTQVVAVSHVYETDPLGGPAQERYFNAVVRIRVERTPRELLELCRALEAAAGRVRRERWGPRTLDVDLLRCEGITVDEADLVVPHPRLQDRAFALVPLHDVDPAVSLDCVDTSDVRPRDYKLS